MATVVSLAVLSLQAERQPIDRYRSIIDRQMFGMPPPGFDPTKAPSEVSAKEAREQELALTKEQEQVKSAIHFSVINVTPSGDTAVGFTDNGDAKNPKHYYLKVGESRDGWTVKAADALKAEMTIAKGEIEVTLTIGGNSASGGGTKKAGAANGMSGAGGMRPGMSAPVTGVRPGILGGRGSLKERRMLREQQKAAAAQAAAEAQAKAAEQEAQREAERAAEKAERDREREEQKAQLRQIQEELKRAREAKEQAREESKENGEGEN